MICFDLSHDTWIEGSIASPLFWQSQGNGEDENASSTVEALSSSFVLQHVPSMSAITSSSMQVQSLSQDWDKAMVVYHLSDLFDT